MYNYKNIHTDIYRYGMIKNDINDIKSQVGSGHVMAVSCNVLQ